MDKIDEMEEKIEEKNLQFYSYRGIAKALSAGISFVTDNFTFILKATLPYAIFYTLVASTLIYLLSDARTIQLAEISMLTRTVQSPGLFAGVGLFLLLLLAACVLYVGFIFRLTHIHSKGLEVKTKKLLPLWKSSLRYSVKYLVYVCCTAVAGMIGGALCVAPLMVPTEGMMLGAGKIAVSMFLFIGLVVACVPLYMVLPSIYFEKKRLVPAATYGYKRGMKMWSKLFGMSIVIGIIEWLLLAILICPAVVMAAANFSATTSALQGDVIDLPRNFGLWFIIILIITQYLASFLFWISIMPFNYLYASMKSDEKLVEEEVKMNLVNILNKEK